MERRRKFSLIFAAVLSTSKFIEDLCKSNVVYFNTHLLIRDKWILLLGMLIFNSLFQMGKLKIREIINTYSQ